jgi:hypothetical protein
MNAMERSNFKLTQSEASSDLWQKLDKYLTRRLEAAREKNDGPLHPDETARVRGEIKSLKQLQALGKLKPPITMDGDESQPL